MSYLIHSSQTAVRRLAQLTGPEDAEPGSVAISPEGDKYAMTISGWLKVLDASTGTGFTPTLPDGTAVTVVGGDITLHLTVQSGQVEIPEGYTLSAD